ncbi:hypothetical protein ACVWZD_005494 [Streptomyces sp. TE3672]
MIGKSNNRPPLIVKCLDSKTIEVRLDRENVRLRISRVAEPGGIAV